MRTLWEMGAAAFVLALGVPLGAARADVTYEVQQSAVGVVNFDATLIVPSFITADTTFPIADFTVTTNLADETNVEFVPDTTGGCSLYGQSAPCDLVNLEANGSGSSYFYPLGTLGETGISASTVGYFTGTVTVSEVPEPASLALLGAGIAAMGFVRRRQAAAA